VDFLSQFALHPFLYLLAISAISSACIACLILMKRKLKGAVTLSALMLELAIWSGAYMMMWSGPTLDTQIFWLNITYFGELTTPITFLVFVMQVTGNDRWVTKRNVLLLCIEPLISFVVIWTNQYHYLFHTAYKLTYVNSFPQLTWGHGLWFWVSTVYSYALIVAAVTFLFRAYMQAGPYFRMQLGTLLIGCILPWGMNIYALFIPNPFRNLDITPISFSISGLIFAFALLRQGLLDILPVARSALIEIITDGVLVLDVNGRIIDINPAAEKILSLYGNLHSQNIRNVFPQWNDLINRILTEKDFYFEVQGKKNPSVFYGVLVAPLKDQRGHESGKLVTFRDISEQKRSAVELEKMNQRLKQQVKKISALRDELREQAIRDPLTNLFNRRYLTETLERELALAKRKGYQVSIIMMDIDKFKSVNDLYGHKEGDRVLQALGHILLSSVRGSDIPCRFGGEEFVIVILETSLEVAVSRARQIRAAFSSMHFFGENASVHPTVSIGVAIYPTHGDDLESILNSADQAMYLAKKTRNTVVVYGENSSIAPAR
jgi:diguanylate cyclase (GGDEF)-like protein/PAS domain S-box-containing protein